MVLTRHTNFSVFHHSSDRAMAKTLRNRWKEHEVRRLRPGPRTLVGDGTSKRVRKPTKRTNVGSCAPKQSRKKKSGQRRRSTTPKRARGPSNADADPSPSKSARRTHQSTSPDHAALLLLQGFRAAGQDQVANILAPFVETCADVSLLQSFSHVIANLLQRHREAVDRCEGRKC